jgi:hypothetical protein
MARKETPQHPAQNAGREPTGDPGAQQAGQGVVEQGGGQDAGDDGPGLAKARRQQQGQQLGLVADLGQCDDAGTDQQGFDHGVA